jgi:hypothetical protein
MAKIEFDQLLELYRNAKFGTGGEDDASEVTVATPGIATLLKRVETDDYAAAETGITLLDDLKAVEVGAVVKARLDAPRSGFAVLARNIDGLIKGPNARIQEPRHFFLVTPPYVPGDAIVPDVVNRYRKALAVVQLFAKAASMLDATKSELVFVKDGKIVMPIQFNATDLMALDTIAADRLLGQFADELHDEQKCSILFEALLDLCRAHQTNSRFRFALRHLSELADRVAEGYRLFASSFSYAKVRSELEDARINYTQKIHRTIVDIQNQLLGIPVATIVVASQMKAPTTCGPELLVNHAVVVGAWIFVAMLIVAILNQWMTLNVIGDEITKQQTTLERDFKTVSADFVATFTKLKDRIWWHHAGLAVVFAIGVLGGAVATFFDVRIASIMPTPCVAAKANSTPSETPSTAPSPLQTPVPTPAPTPAKVSSAQTTGATGFRS